MKQLTTTLVITTITALLTLGAISIQAEEINTSQPVAPQPDDTKNRPKAGKPPEEAITVCFNKAEKTQCEFSSHKGTEIGLCETTPDQQYFACNPKRNK
ncbi:MAG: hypothetical protein GY808_00190 [Gammaproteobacteria bacterium]|nr:hypothetical protein [Gammaproteobacteria bacterium]